MSKSIIGAFVVLVILGIAFVVADRDPYTGGGVTLSDGIDEFRRTDLKDVGRITVTKGDGKVELHKSQARWSVASLYGYPADEDTLDRIVKSVKELQDVTPRESGRSASSHEQFETDQKKGAFITVADSSCK